ncbi:MAG: hypothetical protein KGH65_01725 [Candidatus Micrarchaeota archaeon]|nr:hypothetical protein [Candidatus Micrarchaeota archaeon]
MLNHKAVLISLDAMISLPIVMATFFLIFESYHGNVVQLGSLAQAQTLDLKLYSKSQLLVQAFRLLNLNYSGASSFSANFAKFNRINLTIIPFPSATSNRCQGIHACRIVEIRNESYLVVLKNEDTS